MENIVDEDGLLFFRHYPCKSVFICGYISLNFSPCLCASVVTMSVSFQSFLQLSRQD